MPSSSIQYDRVNTTLSTKSPAPARSASRWTKLSRSWFWEALGMIISFGCTVAIVIILSIMDGQPLSRWTIFISLNATVAILATVAKSMAMCVVASCISQFKWIYFKTSTRKLRDFDVFEDASRGPWGALLLLYYVRWKNLVISIGALATIVALGIDAFAQQLIALYDWDVEQHEGQASFGLSRSYESGAKSMTFAGPFVPTSASVDAGMEAAVLAGIYNSTPPETFDCDSRCIWKEPSYLSLGFASECQNVTAATLATMQTAGSRGFNMTTPSNVNLTANHSQTSWSMSVSVFAVDLTQYLNRNPYFPPVSPEFVRVTVLRNTQDNPGPEYTIDPSALEVFECTISLAAYLYANVSSRGTEFTVEHLAMVPLQPGHIPMTTATGVDENDSLPNNLTIEFNQTAQGVPIPTMRATTADIGVLIQLFTSTRFSGVAYDGETIPAAPTGIGLVLKHGDIPATFDNMARLMTNRLRSGYGNVIQARGLTVNSVVYVRARWHWLMLPASVQVMSAVLLGMAMVSARRHQSVLWKSSNIAVLYHYVHDLADGAVLLPAIHDLNQLDQVAENTRAKLD